MECPPRCEPAAPHLGCHARRVRRSRPARVRGTASAAGGDRRHRADHRETGTGKEVAASELHARSGRAGPFLALNCGALSETLAEAELFGHEKGAFTGALRSQLGYFEAATGGTLLLDEVGKLPLVLQAKLLRVLQEREVTRVGSRTPRRLDARIVAATNVDLPAAVAAGRFRRDDPLAIDAVARTFPTLDIVCCHGCYPHIDTMIGVAFRNERVYVSPDMYLFAPGGRRYAEAATGFLGAQLLFGSSFPFRPMKQSVDDWSALHLDEMTSRLVLGGKAIRLLGRASVDTSRSEPT